MFGNNNKIIQLPLIQVDMAIDACSQLVNLRNEIFDSKTRLDQHVNTGNNKVSRENG